MQPELIDGLSERKSEMSPPGARLRQSSPDTATRGWRQSALVPGAREAWAVSALVSEVVVLAVQSLDGVPLGAVRQTL